MTAGFDVIVCGSLHLDIVVDAPKLPRLDETMVGTGWRQVCGGKGGNQAVQARRAGARTAMIGRVGRDDFGARLRDNLQEEGVETSAVAVDETLGSGMSVAILQQDGDYGAVIVSGANTAITAADLAAHWAALGGAQVLVLQNEIPEAANIAAAAVARAAGARIILNAAPVRVMSQRLLDLVDVLVVNRVEAAALMDRAVDTRDDARAAIAALVTAGRSVVITLGGEGLVVASVAGDVTEIEPLPVQVTSTHGAGDCFVGTLAAQLVAGDDLLAACRAANAEAAAFVSRAL